MLNILIATLVLGAMALVFGLVLTFTAKVFAVPHDPRKDAVREALPGANCAACGYPGCDGCSEAIVAGKAPVNACPVGGAPVAEKIANIMGVKQDAAAQRMVACVRCQGSPEHAKVKFDYKGIHDCVAATTVNDGFKACKFACLGLGTCTTVCKFDAIHIDPERQLAYVDAEKCTACGMCVSACPRNVIVLQPADQAVAVLCNNTGKGKAVMDVCKVGCITCGKCVRTCEYGAITMGSDNLPILNHEKCVKCMKCVEACPTGSIRGLMDAKM